MSDYFVCPICGTDVSIKAKVCPECGSDEKTGWSDDIMYDGLDLPNIDEPGEKSFNSLFQNKYILYIVIFLITLAFFWFYL